MWLLGMFSVVSPQKQILELDWFQQAVEEDSISLADWCLNGLGHVFQSVK